MCEYNVSPTYICRNSIAIDYGIVFYWNCLSFMLDKCLSLLLSSWQINEMKGIVSWYDVDALLHNTILVKGFVSPCFIVDNTIFPLCRHRFIGRSGGGSWDYRWFRGRNISLFQMFLIPLHIVCRKGFKILDKITGQPTDFRNEPELLAHLTVNVKWARGDSFEATSS